jgi:hypothetical protein
MRKLNYGIVAGLLSAPLLLGLSGVANAADYSEFGATVNDEGVTTSQTTSSSDTSDGDVFYEHTESSASEDGASVSGVTGQTGYDENDGLLGLGENDGEDDGLLGLGIL